MTRASSDKLQVLKYCLDGCNTGCHQLASSFVVVAENDLQSNPGQLAVTPPPPGSASVSTMNNSLATTPKQPPPDPTSRSRCQSDPGQLAVTPLPLALDKLLPPP
jgi:hypothetical protein